MPEKYFWRSGREKCFSLDIPSYRTSGLPVIRPESGADLVCRGCERTLDLTTMLSPEYMYLTFLSVLALASCVRCNLKPIPA
jgi:hypothetical protein